MPKNSRKKIKKIKKIKKKRVSGNIRIAVYFLLILSFLIIFSLLVQSIINSKWRNRAQVAVVLEQEDKIYFLKFDKRLQEILIYRFEDNTLMEVAGGYGEYKISKVKELAELEKANLGSMLADSMTFYFGIITDGYILASNKGNFNLNRSLLSAFLSRSKSNLSKWDLINIYFFSKNLRVEDVKFFDINELGFYEKEIRPDGYEISKLNKNKFDNYVLSYITDVSFMEEKFNVEIFNTTNYPGLASIFGRVVANSGFDLIGIRQSKNNYKRSFILVEDELIDNKSIKVLGKYFDFKIMSKLDYQNQEESFGDRAQVVLVLGEDVIEKYF